MTQEDATAWSWVEHLRSGGTSTWPDWRARQQSGDRADPGDPTLPGAAQLEVVRRLALGADPAVPDISVFTALADFVLGAPVGGRGATDLPLTRATPEPQDLPDRELLRVCLAALARFCEEEPEPEPPARPRARPRLRRRRAPVVVVGTTPPADLLRRRVRALGHPDRGAGASVLVVAGPLDAMALGLWRDRVEHGAGVRWRRLWDGFAARGGVPDRLDPVVQARHWAGHVGAERVHLCVHAPGDEHVPLPVDVLGARLPVDDGLATRTDGVDTDLLRRLNQLLASRPPAVRRRPYDGLLAGRLAHPWDDVPGVPGAHLPWAVERGTALRDAILASGLGVHGDPAHVIPSTTARPRSVPVAATLERALAVLGTQFEGGTPWRAR